MLLYLSLSGILLSIILFFLGTRLNKSSVFLSGFFFLVSLYSFIIYVLFYSGSVFLVSLVFINLSSVLFLIGPAIFWYTRSILTDSHRLRKTDLLHLIPGIIFLVTSLPYIFSPYEEKLKIAEELVRNIEFMGSYKPSVLYEMIPAEMIFLSRTLLVLAYTFVSAGMLFRYLRGGNKKRVLSRQRYMTKWLMLLLALLFILAVSHFSFIAEVVMEKSSRLFYTMNLLQISSAIGLAGLLVAPHFFPSILYGLPLISSYHANDPEVISDIRNIEPVQDKMQTNSLSMVYLTEIQNLTESSMSEMKPYLNKDFNMVQLSALINIPFHHLSYFFREFLNQSFHDYRNKWRVEHAKMLITDGKAKDLTLETIGTMSGFTSRNTFFIAFKRAEGISPSDFTSRFKDNL